MFGSQICDFSLWWIFPIVMMVLCFFIMRGRKGSAMCGFGSRDTENQHIRTSDSALDILEKRYALGEINKEEYEERKKTLSQHI